MKTKFYKIVILLLLMLSCKEHQDIEIYKILNNEKKKEVIVKIRNNTNNNYYLLFPYLSVIIDNGFYHTSNYIINGHVTNEKLDSIVCKVYIWDEICNNKEFKDYHRPIVLLPKQSIKEIRYKYDNEKKYRINKFYIDFPYNRYSNEESKKMYFMLKKKLDSSNIIKGYEYYNKDIEQRVIYTNGK